MEGHKHLVECHCILPQYRGRSKPVYHKFVTFSIVDDSNTVIPKYVQCNNCGVVHRVIDLCRSEIMTGHEELNSVVRINDIMYSLPSDLKDVLTSYSCDLATWEQVLFTVENEKWGTTITLTQDTVESETQGKIMCINGLDKIKIESFVRSEEVTHGR